MWLELDHIKHPSIVHYGAVRQFPQGFGTGVASRPFGRRTRSTSRVPPSSVVPLCAAVGWVGAQIFFQAVVPEHRVGYESDLPGPDETDSPPGVETAMGQHFWC